MKYLPTESAESADKATTAPNIPTEAVEIFKEKKNIIIIQILFLNNFTYNYTSIHTHTHTHKINK